jgi:predicted transcriptional regulator
VLTVVTKYRSRGEIIASLLNAIQQGGDEMSNTKLMYKTLLSYTQFKEYAEMLIAKGLIEYNKLDKKFRITEVGIAFLRTWEQIEQMVPLAKLHDSRDDYNTIGIT